MGEEEGNLMDERKVKVRILPLKGIGGVGNAGDEVWMSESDAQYYVREGFVEIIEAEPAPEAKPKGKKK